MLVGLAANINLRDTQNDSRCENHWDKSLHAVDCLILGEGPGQCEFNKLRHSQY